MKEAEWPRGENVDLRRNPGLSTVQDNTYLRKCTRQWNEVGNNLQFHRVLPIVAKPNNILQQLSKRLQFAYPHM